MPIDPRLTRLDENRVRVNNPHGVDTTLFANEQVPVEAAAVTELIELLALQDDVQRVAEAAPDSFDRDPGIVRVAVTPDFHKARGIPVGTVLATRGFVVPQAIGNDINCGMRLHTTTLMPEDVVAKVDELETAFRHIYFEGGRNIPMTRNQRHAMLTGGLEGMLDATENLHEGLWPLVRELGVGAQLDRIERRDLAVTGGQSDDSTDDEYPPPCSVPRFRSDRPSSRDATTAPTTNTSTTAAKPRISTFQPSQARPIITRPSRSRSAAGATRCECGSQGSSPRPPAH